MARQGAKPVKPATAIPALSRNCDDPAPAGSKPGRLRPRRTTSTLVGRALRHVRRDPPLPAGRRSRLPPRLYRRKKHTMRTPQRLPPAVLAAVAAAAVLAGCSSAGSATAGQAHAPATPKSILVPVF